MPYQMSWLAEPRILLVELDGALSISELMTVNQKLTALLDSASQPLYLICDTSHLTEYPHIVTQLRELASYFYHPMFGCQYFYGVRSPAISVIMRLLAGFSPFDYKLVPSLDSALTALEAREPALKPVIDTIDPARIVRHPVSD